MPAPKAVPAKVDMNVDEVRALLLKVAREANAENNSTDTTLNVIVDNFMKEVKTLA